MIILVTGVTAGFGKQIALDCIEHGHTVIGTGRREQILNELQTELGAHFIPLAFDIGDVDACKQALARLPADIINNIDVLINNAGMALGLEPAQKVDFADWQNMINANVLGLANITHQLLPIMVDNANGLIINVGSIAGTYPYPGGNVYGATKAFVKQFSLNLRADLHGTGVRVTNLEPGLCGGTEFSHVRFKGDESKADSIYENVDYVTASDISNIVTWLITQPKHVNINVLEVMPTAQSFNSLRLHKHENAEKAL